MPLIINIAHLAALIICLIVGEWITSIFVVSSWFWANAYFLLIVRIMRLRESIFPSAEIAATDHGTKS